MSTGRIKKYFVIMDIRNLEYMYDGESYDDIAWAETFTTLELAKGKLGTYDDDVKDYLKIYMIEERTEWRTVLIDERTEMVGD